MPDINAFINVWLFIDFDNFDRLRSAVLVDTSNKKNIVAASTKPLFQ